MAKVKAPPCYECQKKPAKLKHAPFCTRECAADFGMLASEQKSYCATCDQWSEWPGGHEHDTVDDDAQGQWRVPRGWGE